MLETLKQYLRYTSWPIIAAMLALITIGIITINAAQSSESMAGEAQKQIFFAILGLGVFVACTAVPYQQVGRAAYGLFAATLIVLAILAAAKFFNYSSFLIPEKRGSYRWINLGFLLIQPSEIAKLTYIIMLAWYLKYRDNYRRLGGLMIPMALTFVPLVLILIEPDLGTSLLFLPTFYFMLLAAGAKWRHLLSMVAIGMIFTFIPLPRQVNPGWSAQELNTRRALAYSSLNAGGKEYLVSAAPISRMAYHQISRIKGWLKQNDPKIENDEGYQLHLSKMVFGSGGFRGSADWNDADLCFEMFPDDHTDFIFSVVGGQWGFLGCLGVLVLYAVIFIFGVEIATITYDPFGRLLAVGVLAIVFSQLFINMGMALGLMPVTGMTLPLVSYGGSSLLINCAALGLLVNVGQRRPIMLGRRPFEHGNGER